MAASRSLLPIVLLAALVTGLVPSWWAPGADWRTSWKPTDSDLHHTAQLKERGGFSEGVRMYCFYAIEEDRDAGWDGGLLGFEQSSVKKVELGDGLEDCTRRKGQRGPPAGPNSRGKLN